MRGNRKIDTRPEVRVRSELHRRGFRFRKHPRLCFDDGFAVRPDITFPNARLAVFVDGCFWHSCPEHGTRPRVNKAYWLPKLERNVERDRLVTERLIEEGWTVLRVWEHEPVDHALGSIEAALRASQKEL